jgi:hypothetical protein
MTTPPSTATLAYDIGEISCSVVSTNASLAIGDGTTVSLSSLSQTGFQQNFSASANIQTYPGTYLSGGGTASGVITYTASETPFISSPSIISTNTTTTSRETELIGTGSTSNAGYVTAGVIRRNSREILNTLDETTYYEVITWEVA